MPTQNNVTKNSRLQVFDSDGQLTKFLETNFTESLKQMIRVVVKVMIKSEMDELRNQVDEKLQFNGNYYRNMLSTYGKVDDIPIPRFRQNPDGDFKPNSLGVFDAEQEKFERLISQMHLLGISQRKIKTLAQTCFNIPISVNKVGVITKELAEAESVNINNKLLDDEYEYIYLDGIWEKTKGYGWDTNKSVLLCALGTKPTGERKIVGFSLAQSEDKESWERLLTSIRQRGLIGKNLKLVTADDHSSIQPAIEKVYRGVPVQSCVIHKMRRVIGLTNFKNRKQISTDIKEVFSQDTKEQATNKAKAMVKKWYMTEPKAMQSLRFGFEQCLTYMDFPKENWKQIRTTNVLEREFREFRRRMKVFDNTFQSPESANRYANSIINYLNSNYPSRRQLHTNC
jgi:putative transposase